MVHRLTFTPGIPSADIRSRSARRAALHALRALALVLTVVVASGTSQAQSLEEALDTPSRKWTLSTEPGVSATTTTDPGSTFDGEDALLISSSVDGAAATLSTTVIGPAVFRYEASSSLQVTLSTQPIGPVTWQVVGVQGRIPVTLRLTGNGSLDRLRVFDSSRPGTLADALGQPGVTWSENGQGPWHVLTDTEHTLPPVLLSPRLGSGSTTTNAIISLIASLDGPRQFYIRSTPGYPSVSLIGDEGRQLSRFGVPLNGASQVQFDFKAQAGNGNLYFVVDAIRATPPPAFHQVMDFPAVTWTTGGALPWMAVDPNDSGPLGADTQAISGTVQRGEFSWLQAGLVGPGIARFRTELLGGGDRVAQLRVNGIPVPLDTGGNNRMTVALPAGSHHMRWELFAEPEALPASTCLLLKDFSWQQTPVDDFAAAAAGVTPFPWLITHCGTNPAWQVASDGPLTAIAKTSTCNSSARLIVPGFGALSAAWKVQGYQGSDSYLTGPKLSSFGLQPSGSYEWTQVTANYGLRLSNMPATTLINQPVWQTKDSLATAWLDDVHWTPAETTTIGEALDLPELTWSTGGTRSGIFQPLSGAAVEGAVGGDAVVCANLQPEDSAWLETTVTGPATLTAKTNSNHPSLILRLDGVPVGRRTPPVIDPSVSVHIPPGDHHLRFEVAGTPGWRSTDFASVDGITLTQTPIPDLAELLDTPGLPWVGERLTLASLPAGESRDGVDSLSLGGPGPSLLSTSVTGPAVLSYWWKAAVNPSSAPNLALMMDDRTVATHSKTQTAWQQAKTPVPPGTHHIAFRFDATGSTFHLDQVSVVAMPALPLADALDLQSGAFPESSARSIMSAALGELAADGVDAVLLHDRQAGGQLGWVPPGPGVLSFQARTLGSPGALRFNDVAGPGTLTAQWSTVSYRITTPPALDGLTLSSTVPLLLDAFNFIADTPDNPGSSAHYGSWLAAQGLKASAVPPDGDLDGDGLSNAVEHAFGLAVTIPDAGKISSGDTAGLPDVRKVQDPQSGESFLEVSFIGHATGTFPRMTYRIESAVANGASLDWTLSPNAPTTMGMVAGKRRYHWRSPTPMTPGSTEFVRVRAAAE